MNEQDKTAYEPKKCELCGAEFGCGANADHCWCAALTLDKDGVDELGKTFADCLCPACLAAAASVTELPDHS